MGQAQAFFFHTGHDLHQFTFHCHCRQTPFVHHFTRAVTRAAACAVECNHIHLCHGRNAQYPFQISRIVASHFEIYIFQANGTEFFNAFAKGFFVPHRQSAIRTEVFPKACFVAFLHLRIGRVRNHQQTILLCLQSILQGCQTVHRLCTFGGLTEFDFNGFTAAFLDGVFRYTNAVIVNIHLQNNLPISTVIFSESIQKFFQLRAMYHFAVFQTQCRVFGYGSFADDGQYAGHSRTAKVILPVQLNQSRQNDGQFQFYRMECADFCFQIHIMNGCLIGIRFRTHSTKHPPIDVEMGVINGILFFRCHLIVPGSGGIHGICTTHSRQTDFTSTYTVRCAHGTHARKCAGMSSISQFCSVEGRTKQRTI